MLTYWPHFWGNQIHGGRQYLRLGSGCSQLLLALMMSGNKKEHLIFHLFWSYEFPDHNKNSKVWFLNELSKVVRTNWCWSKMHVPTSLVLGSRAYLKHLELRHVNLDHGGAIFRTILRSTLSEQTVRHTNPHPLQPGVPGSVCMSVLVFVRDQQSPAHQPRGDS